MARLKDKVQNALDEARLLILGTQVLLGFQYRAAFERGFDKLSRSERTHRVHRLQAAMTDGA